MYSTIEMAKSILGMALCGHWMACAWGMQGALVDNKMDSWLGHFELCGEYPVPNGTVVMCDSPSELYVTCLYWAIMTITSVGYGDFYATNTSERIVATVLITIGSVFWGFVLVSLIGVMGTLNPAVMSFRFKMDDLNRFMEDSHLPYEMRRRLREYFHQTRHLQLAEANRDLLCMMSPALQGEVALRCNARWLLRVPYLKDVQQRSFMVHLALLLTPIVFAPNELITPGFLYIMHRGVVLVSGRICTAGDVWGEDMILSAPELQRRSIALAMTYVEVYCIARTEFMQTAESFPNVYRKIRKHVGFMALRTGIMRVAKQRLAENAATAKTEGALTR
mgnify:CR=1 FL=1